MGSEMFGGDARQNPGNLYERTKFAAQTIHEKGESAIPFRYSSPFSRGSSEETEVTFDRFHMTWLIQQGGVSEEAQIVWSR